MDCNREYSIREVIFKCDSCGGLLSVEHDVESLRKDKTPTEWKDLFVSRYRAGSGPYSSGVWGKKEWILPEIDDDHIISLGEGASPLLNLPAYAKDLKIRKVHVKQCGVTHTGSFKDLGMTVLVSHVRSLIAGGATIRAVACASTGDTSAALAAYAAASGIPTIVFLPKGKVSLAQLIQPISSGAIVLSLDTDFDGCMKIVREITENDRSLYLANSMNPLRMEGQKSIAVEITQQLGWNLPDWVVIPGGNLGNASALGAGFLLMQQLGLITKLPRIAVAQAANANPLYLSFQKSFGEYTPVVAKKTQASAIQIGDPVSYPRAVKVLKQFSGVVAQATEEELAEESARADRFGLFNCPHTGVALAATRKLIQEGTIGPDQEVVIISTAHGLKFTEFKTGYHEGSEGNFRNLDHFLPADTATVRKTIDSLLGKA